MTASRRDREDLAARVRGDHPDTQSFNRYVRWQLRMADIRAQMYLVEIRTIREMLRDGAIDGEMALEELARADALEFLIANEPPWEDFDGG